MEKPKYKLGDLILHDNQQKEVLKARYDDGWVYMLVDSVRLSGFATFATENIKESEIKNLPE